jgi:predicted nucleic acid-binding protein
VLGIYLDTSALAKLYHTENGSSKVEQLIRDSTGNCFVSRLGMLEMRSVLAQKTRAGEISPVASVAVLQRFRGDIRRRRFRVVSLRTRHYELAEHLVDVYGISSGLRALDSLHLAMALDLQQNRRIDSIIAADKVLCRVAPLERLPAINPEAATP